MLLETIVFQVTSRCPYKCSQCYMQKGNAYLGVEDFKHYLEMLKNNGGRMVQFTGGEPMLNQKLPELISYATNNNLYSALATSGYGHSIETYKNLKAKGLSVLCVSLNDIEESKNAISRETYDVSLSAIKTACAVGLSCFVNVVVTDDNICNIELLSHYLFGLGVEMISFLRPVKSFDKKYVPSVSIGTIQKLKEIVETNHESYIVEGCFKEYWEYVLNKKFKCEDAGNKSVFVNADATISPCSQLQQYRYSSIEEMLKAKSEWEGECCK